MGGEEKIIYTGPSSRGWHRLQQAAECLQKYAWKYEAPKKEADTGKHSPALAKGSLIHLALAQHYAKMRAAQKNPVQQLGMMDDDTPESWCDPEEAVQLIAKLEGIDDKIANIAIQSYRDYCRVYPFENEMQTMKIVGVEDLMSVKIKGKYLLTGRQDLTYEDMGGRIWVCDHKCEPAGTEVLTPDGPCTVGELAAAGKDWTCGAWDEQCSTTVWSKALAPVDAGVQDVYSIALADGTTEKHGYRHPLLTEGGWKQVKDVREGDWIAVAPPPDLPEKDIPDAALQVLGLALSDGGRARVGSSYVITATDLRIREYLVGALDTLGDSWALHTSKGVSKGIRLHVGGQARAFIEAMGIHEKLSVDKVFPRELLGLSPRQAGILLGALWEGDGAAYLGTLVKKSGRKPVRIVFSSRSRSLAEGVRHLLLQLGILSNVTESTAVGTPYFQTVVVGRGNKVRFLGLALGKVIDSPVTRAGGRKTRSGRVLEPLCELLQVLADTEPKGLDTRIRKPGQGRHKNPTLEDGIRWVKVKSNLCIGQERCYDIEVPEYHTFLTGHCVVTHNTTARMTARHKQFYAISGQLLGYSHMARAKYGDKFAGFKVNLIQHGDNPKFDRITLPRSPNLEARFEQTIVDIEESIERMQVSGRDFDDWPKAMNELTCFHRYGACEFIDLCRHGYGAKKAGNWTWKDL